MPRILPRIRRTRRGRFQLRLPAAERALLRQLAEELRELLGTEDPALARLFPPGYASDPESDRQYREMVRGDLTAERLAGLQILERTLDSTSLDEEESLPRTLDEVRRAEVCPRATSGPPGSMCTGT